MYQVTEAIVSLQLQLLTEEEMRQVQLSDRTVSAYKEVMKLATKVVGGLQQFSKDNDQHEQFYQLSLKAAKGLRKLKKGRPKPEEVGGLIQMIESAVIQSRARLLRDTRSSRKAYLLAIPVGILAMLATIAAAPLFTTTTVLGIGIAVKKTTVSLKIIGKLSAFFTLRMSLTALKRHILVRRTKKLNHAYRRLKESYLRDTSQTASAKHKSVVR
jgi:hypothetical protein